MLKINFQMNGMCKAFKDMRTPKFESYLGMYLHSDPHIPTYLGI